MLEKLRKYLAETSPEQKEADWAEVKALGLKGPTVNDFLKTFKVNNLKMTNKTEYKRAYIRSSRAFYSRYLPSENIQVMVGLYHPEGGTCGEFEFEWVPLSNGTHARLKAFEDSWDALWQFQDLLQKMAEIDDTDIQEPEFCELLDSLGIVDITEYEQGVPKNKL